MSSVTIGGFLILLGFSFLVKAFFGIDLPLIPFLIGACLIYWGSDMISRQSCFRNLGHGCAASKSIFASDSQNNFDVKFAKRVLYQEQFKQEPFVRVTTVCGKTIIKLDPTIPTQIRVHAVASSVIFPDGNMISFGDVVYNTQMNNSVEPEMVIETKTVFGSLEIVF